MVREGLRSLLEGQDGIEIVGESSDGPGTLETIRSVKPDVAIIDISMPGSSGVDVIRAIQEDGLLTRVLVLTMHEEASYVEKVVKLGAHGFLLKTAPRDKIISAITTIARGKLYYGPHATSVLAEGLKGSSSTSRNGLPQNLSDKLTAREKEIVRLIADGLSSQEIADKLFVSRRTVDTHRSNIMKKLGLRNTSALIRFAIERHGSS
jgi:DNA-binding NarL/FixJ family response regulator